MTAWAHALAGALLLFAPASTRSGGSGPGLVRMVQQRLVERGYAPGYPDGKWGPHSASAMRDFQQAHGLEATGTPDPETLEALWSPEPRTSVQPVAGRDAEEGEAVPAKLDFGFGVGVGFLAAAALTAIGLWWRAPRRHSTTE